MNTQTHPDALPAGEREGGRVRERERERERERDRGRESLGGERGEREKKEKKQRKKTVGAAVALLL